MYAEKKEEAIKLRKEGKTLTNICQVLSLNKSTVYSWIKELKDISIKTDRTESLKKACEANRKKYAQLRSLSYNKGIANFEEYIKEPLFKEYVMLYATEGFRRAKNCVEVGNITPSLLRLFIFWTKKLSCAKRTCTIALYKDIDKQEALTYWSKELGINTKDFVVYLKKSFSKKSLHKCKYGICYIRYNDTYLKVMIDAWITLMKKRIDKYYK